MRVCDRASRLVRIFAVAAFAAVLAAFPASVQSQNNNNGNFLGSAVGGVSVDARGVLNNVNIAQQGELQAIRLDAVPGGLGKTSQLRKVSLSKLHAAIEEQVASGKPLPDSIQFLAGLQQVRYVLVYPEQNDIVLVGPGEGWKLDQRGSVVGSTTNRPVLLLDDLLTAIRTASGNVRSVMSCSIDPTAEGIQRLRNATRQLQPGNPQGAAASVEQQLGPQKITIQGVAETSHFARVMVAADYRMKRISMSLEPAPIAGLPGFMDMMRAGKGGMSNMLPRWWLEPNFDPLLRDPAGLSWEIRGASVKTMTETDFFDANGIQRPTGKTDPVSQRWADMMTSRYNELAVADPVFGQLRNCMELAVVGALIAKENLADKAGAKLPLLTGSDGIRTVQFDAPKQVDSKAALAKKGTSWMIAAGGVSINPWKFVEKAETDTALAQVHDKSKVQGDSWWWD